MAYLTLLYQRIVDAALPVGREQLKLLMLSVILAVCMIATALFYRLYKKGKEAKETELGQRFYRSIEESLRHNRLFDYARLQRWLKRNGAASLIKGFGDPFTFLSINTILILAVLVGIGSVSDLFTAFLVATGLLLCEVLLLVVRNRKDNDAMMQDILFLYNGISIQLASSIYIAQAVENCLEYIRNKRLKKALEELVQNLSFGGDIRTATLDFREKFDNTYLNTFCNLLVQVATQTGEVTSLMEDMSVQLTALAETSFLQQKKKTENRLQLGFIGIFLIAVGLIFYLSIVIMLGSAETMF